MKLATALLLVGVLHAPGVPACACVSPEVSLEQHVASLYANSAIVGVFEIEGFRVDTVLLDRRRELGRWAVLRQRHSFKGDAPQILVRAPARMMRTDCDMRYRKGDLLLVYSRSPRALHLGMCSDSGLLMSRFEQLPVLFRLSAGADPE